MKNKLFVESKEWLYRTGYSTPEKKYMNPDGTATSRVFKLREKDNGGLSVDVKSLTNPELSVRDSQKIFLFEISNTVVENQGLKTYHDPLEDGSNYAHAIIDGMTLEDDILPSILAKNSKRVYINIPK